jgi:hypothetical protein
MLCVYRILFAPGQAYHGTKLILILNLILEQFFMYTRLYALNFGNNLENIKNIFIFIQMNTQS